MHIYSLNGLNINGTKPHENEENKKWFEKKINKNIYVKWVLGILSHWLGWLMN